jgi:hypothetical protein
MKSFNPFRMSFDTPLRPAERTRARVTATIVGGAAILLGISSVGALLNASSQVIGTWANAEPPAEARLLTTEAEDPAGKSCDEQTWPYLEARCLKSADTQAPRRSTPKHGLGSQQIALPDAPVTNAPRSPISPAPERGTTGSAAYDDRPEPIAADPTGETSGIAVPLPVPAPALAAPSVAAPGQTGSLQNVSGPDAAQQRSEARPVLSERQQRRLQRQERKKWQRQRREEARKLRHERLRARHEARRPDDMFFIFR